MSISYAASAQVTPVYASAYARVSFTAAAVVVILAGTTPDANSADNILVGQGCTAYLVDLPVTFLSGGNLAKNISCAWSVSGTTFQGWNPTTSSAALPVINPILPSSSTVRWYWNDLTQANETINCVATVTPPDGQGAPFNFTLPSQSVTVKVPDIKATATGGYMQVNKDAPKPLNGTDYLYAGPNAGHFGGMDFDATVQTPPPFTGGKLELVQIVTPYKTNVRNTNPPELRSSPENNMIGLDSTYPYLYPGVASGVYSESTTPFSTNDTPAQQLGAVTPTVASAVLKDTFTDYLMYQPPGSDVQWVPRATSGWKTDGSATIPYPSGDWSQYKAPSNHYAPDGSLQTDWAGTVIPTGASASTNTAKFVPGNTFPSWDRVNVSPSY